ncbi:MAG TPA: alanine racemase [Pirellulaceae bacterium]|nr:alanine racemase [Pirellulaceae bacterium]
MTISIDNLKRPDEATLLALREIASRYGTPTYAFDVRRLSAQVAKLRSHLPPEVDILYSLKSNASLGICDVLSGCGIGADVASAGELATAIEAGFPTDRIFVAGPFKLPETIAQLRETPEAIVSIDSLSELQWLSDEGVPNSVVLRLRPDFGSCAVVPAGSESRFGFTCDELQRCRDFLPSCNLDVIGFHVFAGSQVLDAGKLNEHLRRALDLSLRAAETLAIAPRYINLGGGFGIPYAPADEELDLVCVGDELANLVARAAPARIVLELGRYLVAEAGWYLTSVVGHQTFQGRSAVIVDGGVHQRADMCGLCLRSNQSPPLVLGADDSALTPTDVLGCLSLPDDVLLQSSPLPRLSPGDVLAFGNAGAYGLWSSPALFHGSPLPAEAAFDGSEIHLMRERKPARSILEDQCHVVRQAFQPDSQPGADSAPDNQRHVAKKKSATSPV